MIVERDTVIMTRGLHETLCKEVRYLHGRMFRSCPAANFVDAYVHAHIEIFDLRALDARQLRTVNMIVAHRLDAVAIEPWLRGKGIRHALSTKLLLLAYLAECDTRHLEFMRGTSDGRIALVSMGRATFMATFRLICGYVQKAWYGLV